MLRKGERPLWPGVGRVGSMEEATLKLGLKEEMGRIRESSSGSEEDGCKNSKAQRGDTAWLRSCVLNSDSLG